MQAKFCAHGTAAGRFAARAAVLCVAILSLAIASGFSDAGLAGDTDNTGEHQAEIDGSIYGFGTPIPPLFAHPVAVLVEDSGISCVTIPCPHFDVTEPITGLTIAVETLVVSTDPTASANDSWLWELISADLPGPLSFVGHVEDRPRRADIVEAWPEHQRNQIATQRVLVIAHIR